MGKEKEWERKVPTSVNPQNLTPNYAGLVSLIHQPPLPENHLKLRNIKSNLISPNDFLPKISLTLKKKRKTKTCPGEKAKEKCNRCPPARLASALHLLTSPEADHPRQTLPQHFSAVRQIFRLLVRFSATERRRKIRLDQGFPSFRAPENHLRSFSTSPYTGHSGTREGGPSGGVSRSSKLLGCLNVQPSLGTTRLR